MNKSPRTPMDIALNLLSRRGYSAKEMLLRLRRSGMEGEAAEQVVSECIRLGLINDEMYARDYAEVLAARGLGSRRIRMELNRRGVAEYAGEAAEELAEGELERAINAGQVKLRLISPGDPPLKKRQKLYRFLSSRGFGADIVRDAVDRLMRGAAEDTDF